MCGSHAGEAKSCGERPFVGIGQAKVVDGGEWRQALIDGRITRRMSIKQQALVCGCLPNPCIRLVWEQRR